MSQTAVAAESTARDFDFWMGRWKGHNCRLRERLAGCTEWEEFESKSIARSILGGTANEDVFLTDYAGGYSFGGLGAGGFTDTMTVPAGYTAVGPTSVQETLDGAVAGRVVGRRLRERAVRPRLG